MRLANSSEVRAVVARRRVGAGVLGALVVVVSAFAAGAEDAVWRISGPPGALTTCADVAEFCIEFADMKVYRTPNDAGSFEEWKLRFGQVSLGPESSKFMEIKVKDSYPGPGKVYPVGLTHCFPVERAGLLATVTGKEEDVWPNPDDSIPEFRVLIVNPCSITGSADREITHKGMEISYFTKNDDDKRRAAYRLVATYR